jgi:hypothetical protein
MSRGERNHCTPPAERPPRVIEIADAALAGKKALCLRKLALERKI